MEPIYNHNYKNDGDRTRDLELFFLFSSEERKYFRINLLKFLYKGEELENIVCNLKKDGRANEIDDFLLKSGAKDQIDKIYKEKKAELVFIQGRDARFLQELRKQKLGQIC